MPIPVIVPREPIILGFDPMKTEDKDTRAIFKDDVARSLWLLIKPGHLTGEDFPKWCLDRADQIREKSPSSPEDLYTLLGHPFFPYKFSEECRDFMVRLFRAVTRALPVFHRVILPDTVEARVWEEEEIRRGYDDALAGKEPAGALFSKYGRGYQLAKYGKPLAVPA